MIEIADGGLKAFILDPLADRARLGSRFCVGGYIWQVEDFAKGPLFSGPQYPNAHPPAFDGQGLPEAFEIALGQNRAKVGDDVYVIGVGRVKRISPVKPFHVRNNPAVTEFAPWTVHIEPSSVTMTSNQAFEEWGLRIIRKVSLADRILTSATTVTNTGEAELPLRWFAHPFFQHAGLECFGFSGEVCFPFWVPEGGGFRWNSADMVERSPDYDWNRGCFQLAIANFGYPIDAVVNHPLLGQIKVECRFPLAWLPMWANPNAVSFEPYHHTMLAKGLATEWSIRYLL